MLAYEYIKKNKRRSLILAAMFPVSFTLFAFLVIMFFHSAGTVFYYLDISREIVWKEIFQSAFVAAHEWCKIVLPICFVLSAFWARIAIKDGGSVVLKYIPGIRPIFKLDHFDACTALENLCITAGMPLPDLYELNDDSLNAFSVGVCPEHSAIILSKGILEKLDRPQLEGVLAHELVHIRNYDTRVMAVLITCLAFFTFAGEMFVYGTEKENLTGDPKIDNTVFRMPPFLLPVGLALMAYGYFVAPMIRLALSREREALADAEAVLLTRNPQGLAKALWRISEDSRLETLDRLNLVGAMCIENPHAKPTFFERLSGIGKAHPPVGERIHALNDMDSLFLQTK